MKTLGFLRFQHGFLAVLLFAQAVVIAAEGGANAFVRFTSPEYVGSRSVGFALALVERVGSSSGEVTVEYWTADGTAENGGEFHGAQGTVTFGDNDTAPKAILVELIQKDYHVERSSFELLLRNASGALIDEPGSATIHIDDGYNPGCAGRLDYSFKPPTDFLVPLYANRRVYTAVDSNDKTLVAGPIFPAGQAVVRLNSDGSLDPTFDDFRQEDDISSSELMRSLTRQPDGKILVSGWFPERESALMRLNENGGVDHGFQARIGQASGTLLTVVRSVSLTASGKIIAGGFFNLVNGTERINLVRLNQDGSIDPGFTPNLETTAGVTFREVRHVATVGDKVLVVEALGLTNGYIERLIRVNQDGSLDTSFVGADFESITALEVQPDGRILLGVIEEYAFPRLIRFLPDGEPDSSWSEPSIGGAGHEGIMKILLASDGQIYVSGSIESVEDSPRPGVARLFSNGVIDPTFNPSLRLSTWADDVQSISSLALQSTGNLIIAGDFHEVDGAVRKGVARLYTQGAQCSGVIALVNREIVVSETDTNVVIQLLRTGETNNAITVYYQFKESDYDYITGHQRKDFGAGPGFVTFSPGETSKALLLPLINDIEIEEAESFEIVLREPTNGGVLEHGTYYAKILILDDDSQGLPGMPAPDLSPLGFVAGARVNALTLGPNDEALVGGSFAQAYGRARRNIARLHPNLAIDDSFSSNGVPFEVYAIKAQQDGKILVGGEGGVVRLEFDGAPDPSFVVSIEGLSARVEAITLQPDGKILIGGKFERVNGLTSPGIARLLPSGALDPSFGPSGLRLGQFSERGVSDVELYQDGKIVVAGSVDGRNGSSSVARLTASGQPDDSFIAQPWNVINEVLVRENGNLLVGGDFRQFEANIQWQGLAGLLPNGKFDTNFIGYIQVDYGNVVREIITDRSGKILVAGHFVFVSNQYPYSEFLHRSGLARFQANGRVDPTFFVGSGSEREIVKAVIELPDGSYLAGGDFTRFAGEPRPALVHLYGDRPNLRGKVQFAAPGFREFENKGSVNVKVERLWGAKGEITVAYQTVNRFAKAGEDYVAAFGTLTFAEGETNKTIEITLLDDDRVELWEAFSVVLSAPDGDSTLGFRTSTDVAIWEDDYGLVFDHNSFQVSGAGTISVSVYFYSTNQQPVTVQYQTRNGSAIAGEDFVAKSATLTIDPDDGPQMITIEALPNTAGELVETFEITLSNPSIPVDVRNTAVITILAPPPADGFVPESLRIGWAGQFTAELFVRPGISYEVWTSTDLEAWTLLKTFTASGQTDTFIDVLSVQGTARFYRLIESGD